ncbi:MAG: PAS domain S-box protein [Proteobacteria bacterium]|nr:PAS domain S-box protein [Pseudomonadota bacterium]
MSLLDQQTLYVVLSVSAAGAAAVFAGIARYAPRIDGPALWSAASLCTVVAFGSGVVSVILPGVDWHVWSLLFNVSFATGPVLLFAGLARFYAGRRFDRAVGWAIALAVAATVAFTWAWPSTAARVGVLSAIVAAAYGGGAAVAWLEPRGPGRIIARILALTFITDALATLGRALMILFDPRSYSFESPDLAHINSLVWIANTVLSGVALPLMTLAVAVRLMASLQAARQRAEASEAQFRELAASAGVGILVTDAAGVCTYANPRWEEIAGLPPGATLGDGWRQAFLPEDVPAVQAAWRDAVRGEGPPVHTFRIRRPNGELRWARARPVALRSPDGRQNRYLATVEDITSLRHSYERIRELAQRLETVREDERRSVAHALHEGIAQDLVAATLDLNRLRSQTANDSPLRTACDEVARAIDKCIRDLRELTNSLRPGMLVHLPLVTAVSQYARQFSERAGLHIEVSEASPTPRLNDATRLVFFRAVQEALMNVARHARATRVAIRLLPEPGRMTLTVDDDGIGVADRDLDKANALGLLGVQERFAALGGGLVMSANEPRGTRFSVHLPLEHE